MKNLAKAILSVMQEVKGIDKSMTIGTGASAYKGVPDKDVKKVIGEAMQKNGLCILPISVNPTTKIDRWEETNQFGTKMKQSIFTEVTTKYLLLHESGESVELSGYGHGIDNQDKGAGKASTYALKYTLLYLFLVPTGKIDDTDNEHSDSKDVPKQKVEVPQNKVEIPAKVIPAPMNNAKPKPELKENTVAFASAHYKIHTGEITLDDVEKRYSVSEPIKSLLLNNNLKNKLVNGNA